MQNNGPTLNTNLLPEVFTDKLDYAPGETVAITGNGYEPNSTVEIQIADDLINFGDDGDVDTYNPIKVTVDENGLFTVNWTVPTDNNGTGTGTPDALNATLNLTATGAGSDGKFGTIDDQIATTTFTDSSNGSSQMAMNAQMVHPDDPAKMREHMALLDLLPRQDATFVAKNGRGNWFDPKTWQGGKIPDAGAKVLIPTGATVYYNGSSNASLDVVRVDGTLEFATNINTKMVVDTLFTDTTSTLRIGSKNKPIQANKTAVIEIDGSTAIDKNWDPTLISRGVITHGKVEVFGANKDDFLSLAKDAKKGDNKLVLEKRPAGWKVGDTIVLGGTQTNDKGSHDDNSKFQDEVLEITGIQGNVITFRNTDITSGNKNVLRFDHVRPQGFQNQLNLYVANTSRNIQFQTKNADQVPTQQRGHVMFMHNPDVVVENAGFYGLGRSDKGKLVDDTKTNLDGRPGKGTNPRGRYALHFHKTGVDDLNSKPSIARGNAIVDSPGWGITHHESNAIVEDNVVFDVVGSGIVAESGNELGAWRNNITIKTLGISTNFALRRYGPKSPRLTNFDMGVNGEGYWVQGAGQVAMENNVAISANGGGVNFFGGADGGEKERPIDHFLTKNLPNRLKPVAQGQDSVDIHWVPLKKASGFEIYNVEDGMFVWGRTRNDFGNKRHDVYSYIDNFKIWGVRSQGIRITYSAKNEFSNGIIIGNPDNPSGRAFVGNSRAREIVYKDLYVNGFEQGLRIVKEFNDSKTGEPLNSRIENVTIENTVEDIYSEKNNKLVPFTDYLEIVNSNFDIPANNTKPTPKFNYSGNNDLTVSFDASGSFDVDVPISRSSSNWEIASYGWDFNNDGRIDSFGRKVEHTFGNSGNKKVRLTVWDSEGANNSLIKTIKVGGGGSSTSTNTAPQAVNDSKATNENKSTTINVLNNDRDADGDTLSILSFDTNNTKGAVTLNNGRFSYNPNGKFGSLKNGEYATDSFTYTIDDGNGGTDTATVTVTINGVSGGSSPPPVVPPKPSSNDLYLSLQKKQKNLLSGESASQQDIVKFDGNNLSMFFDGSDVGIKKNIFAFDIVNNTEVLISFNQTMNISGVGQVVPGDVVKFVGTSFGTNTAGSFESYFDGSDVGLKVGIDALTKLSNGNLLISTTSKTSLPGVGTIRNEDILLFKPKKAGDYSQGTWSKYLDGGSVDLNKNSEDIDALSIDNSGKLLISTRGDFDVKKVLGADEDVFVFNRSSSTSGNYNPNLLFDGSVFGLGGNDISGIDVSTSY